jgi:hypothetical protein
MARTPVPSGRLVRLAVPVVSAGLVLFAAMTGSAGAQPASGPAHTAASGSATARPDADPTPPDPKPGTLTTTTPTVTQGAPITFTYATSAANFNDTDWLGIYSDPGCGPVSGTYVCPSTTYLYTPTATGSLTFPTSSLAPGHYIVFYLYDNEYHHLAKPLPFTIDAVAPVAPPTYTSTLTRSGLDDPQGLFQGPAGRIWAVNAGSDTVVEYSAVTGKEILRLGRSGSAPGELRDPRAVTVDGMGHVFVADTGNNRVEEYTTRGTFIRTIGRIGTAGGEFESPEGIALHDGVLYVSDDADNRIETFSTSTGAYVSAITGDELSSPAGLWIDGAGDLWAAQQGQTDTAQDGVVELSPSGTVLLTLESDNTTTYGGFNDPTDVAVDRAGHIFVAEPDLDYVQEFDPDGVFLNEFGTSGVGTLSFPTAVVVTHAGRILVADSGDNRLVTFTES